MFTSICFIRAGEQEQLESNSMNSTRSQNGTERGSLDLEFYLGIYGGEKHSNIISD